MKPAAILLQLRARRHRRRRRRCCTALAAQRLRAYITDFPTPELVHQPGVVACLTSARRPRKPRRTARIMVVDQVREYLEHGSTRNAVNFPDVEMTRESPLPSRDRRTRTCRTCSGQISTTMAHHGLNIHNMVNKSRGEMAYTLVDVDSPWPTGSSRRSPPSRACSRCARFRPNPDFRNSYANFRRAPDCASGRERSNVGVMDSRALIGFLVLVAFDAAAGGIYKCVDGGATSYQRHPAGVGRTRFRSGSRACPRRRRGISPWPSPSPRRSLANVAHGRMRHSRSVFRTTKC
jgi:hypothetical protein